MVASATNPRYAGLDQYMKLGWVPADKVRERCFQDVEYAYDDWTIARMATPWDATDVAARFARARTTGAMSSTTKTGFVRARNSDGNFREPFDPAVAGNGDYTEGNAWQYSWYAPQDTAELIRRMGGDQQFRAQVGCAVRLEGRPERALPTWRIFRASSAFTRTAMSRAITSAISTSTPAARGARSSDWRRSSRASIEPTPDGLAGNDDLGQMSAWLLFTALGFYPVTPGSGEYVIGRPFVDRAVLHLPNGKLFTVVVDHLVEPTAMWDLSDSTASP